MIFFRETETGKKQEGGPKRVAFFCVIFIVSCYSMTD